jgi:hypothetical protein
MIQGFKFRRVEVEVEQSIAPVCAVISIPFILETARLLATLFRPNHLVN